MFHLSSRLILATAFSASLFVTSAMADGLTVRGPQFTPNPSAVSTGAGGGGGGGHQQIMNDDYYHPPKADDPGKMLNLLTARHNPLDTSSFVAKDMGKDITVLTAKDGLLPDGFVIRDIHKNTDFLVVNDAHGHQIAMWVKDYGARHIMQINDLLMSLRQQEEDKNLPDCKPDTPYGTPCAPRDCWQEELLGLPCPR